MKKAELYHRNVELILLDGNPLKYTYLNYGYVYSVMIDNKELMLYQSKKGYFFNNNGKRQYVEVVRKK